MSNERLIWQGQKQDKELAAKQLKTSIEGLRNSIRTELNPHSPVREINPDMVSQQAFELADKVVRYNGLLGEIAAINKSLGLA